MRTSRYGRARRCGGYTLIEAFIVMLYMGIIATIVLPRITGAGRRAAETNLRATIREIRGAIASFQAETGVYPATLDDIVTNQPPAYGLNEQGLEVPVYPQDFHGPYLIPSAGRLPLDRVTGKREWSYETQPPHVGAVHSLSTGTSIDGTPYSEF